MGVVLLKDFLGLQARYLLGSGPRFMDAFKNIDMCGPSEQLVIKDELMNGLGMVGANSSLNRKLALPPAQPTNTQDSTLLTISEYLSVHYGKTIKSNFKDLTDIGKEVAMMYMLEVGEEFASGVEIPHKPHSVNGRFANVDVYGTKPVALGKRSAVGLVVVGMARLNIDFDASCIITHAYQPCLATLLPCQVPSPHAGMINVRCSSGPHHKLGWRSSPCKWLARGWAAITYSKGDNGLPC